MERHQRTLERAVMFFLPWSYCIKLRIATCAFLLEMNYLILEVHNLAAVNLYFWPNSLDSVQAKALAEKNERDMQTQREQAERHVCFLVTAFPNAIISLINYFSLSLSLSKKLISHFFLFFVLRSLFHTHCLSSV